VKRKLIVEVEVDTNELFDTLKKMKGDTSGVTDRVVDLALTREGSWRELVGLSVYGIDVKSITESDWTQNAPQTIIVSLDDGDHNIEDVSPESLLWLEEKAHAVRDLSMIVAINREFWRRKDDPRYF
jgi:hypothetical protein